VGQLDVAEEIVRQMGGMGRLRAMIGAKDFIGGPNWVKFSWPAKAKNGANTVKILLQPDDTYWVGFFYVRRGMTEPTWKGQWDGIYADGLKRLFEQQTGLYLSL
jgi:hypothetical protein